MILGEKAAELTCAKAPFEDVAASRWSAPCISWCVEREILLGYGNGRYGPADLLTGDQFAKMLLCALNLAREGSYVGLGAGWKPAVREDAQAAGLYAGDAAMKTEQPITRQQAALLAWNAVQAAEAPPKPAAPSSSSPGSNPGNDGDIETPEIDIHDDDPVQPESPAPEPPSDDSGNDSGDILLPEVP